MAEIGLDLIPEDYRKGHRGNPWACMIERGLEREYGGRWKVGGSLARQRGKAWPREWTLGEDAAEVIGSFDSGASLNQVFRGQRTRRITLYGKPLTEDRAERSSRSRPLPRPRRSLRSRRVTAAAGAGLGGLVLAGTGYLWETAAGAAALLAGAGVVKLARSEKVIAHVGHGQHQAPARPPDPDWDWDDGPERAVPPSRPEPVPEPAPEPAPAPEPVRARWPESPEVPAEVFRAPAAGA